jgi:serine/threonine-protein kinase
VKLLDPRFADEAGVVSRFDREAGILEELDDPHIIRLLEGPERDGERLFFVMEYVEGKTVRELLAETGWLDGPLCLRIAMDVLAGLEVSHHRGIIHRDLKPGNVIVKKSGRSKIADFGLGLFFGATRFTASGEVFGTPAYMSPEQARGDKVDHLSDIYGVGVLLYEMITGAPPFDAEHPLVLMKKIVEQEPSPIESRRAGLPREINEAVEKAMRKDPRERFASAREMADVLATVEFEGESRGWEEPLRELVERDTTSVAAPAGDPGGSRIWVASLGLILLAATAGGAWAMWGREAESGKEVVLPNVSGTRLESAPPGKGETRDDPKPLGRGNVRLILRGGREIRGELLEGDGEALSVRDSKGELHRLPYGEIQKIFHDKQ